MYFGSWRNIVTYALICAAITACAYRPNSGRGDIDNPVTRKVSWYSYLDGSDIRENCQNGGPDQYRLVYNGQYEKQLRSYELVAQSDGTARLIARAAGDQNAFNVTLFSPEDAFGPWRWQKSESTITSAAFQQFRTLLAQSGFGEKNKKGKRLYSRDFYWIAVGCESGSIRFQTWVAAKDEFTHIQFKDFLLAQDGTKLPFREPVPVFDNQRRPHINKANDNVEPIFVLTVEQNGLGGITNF